MSFVEHLLSIPMESKFPDVKKVGNGYMMLCPFHDDKNPSLSVFPEGNYHCFACGEKGNYVSYLMKTQAMTVKEAYEKIESLTGVKLGIDENPEKKKFHELNELAAQFYMRQLDKAPNVRDYLIKRGITDESIKRFRLGCTADASTSLYKELKSNGFSPQEIRKAGLIRTSDERDFFQQRLMIPIINGDDKIHGFAGRSLLKGNGAKYINSPETAFFKKSSLFFGLNQEGIRSHGHIIIVEGYFDAIAFHQKGYNNAVALMGTVISDRHVELIKRTTNKVVVACDGDDAGQKATVRIVKQLITQEKILDISVADFDEDPASFILKGGDIEGALSNKKSGAAHLISKVTDAKERQEIIYCLAANFSAPEFLSSLSESERFMFAEISAREMLTSLREKMKPLVRLKNTEIEVRQFDRKQIAFLEGKMVAVAHLNHKTPKESAVEFARAAYRGIGLKKN